MLLFPLAQAGGEAPSSIFYDHFMWLHIQFVDSLELFFEALAISSPSAGSLTTYTRSYRD